MPLCLSGPLVGAPCRIPVCVGCTLPYTRMWGAPCRIPWVWERVCTLPYTRVWERGVYPAVYASLYARVGIPPVCLPVYPGRCTLPCVPCPVRSVCVMLRTGTRRGDDSYSRPVEEGRLCAEESGPFSLRNKPQTQRKPPKRGKETRHRKHC